MIREWEALCLDFFLGLAGFDFLLHLLQLALGQAEADQQNHGADQQQNGGMAFFRVLATFRGRLVRPMIQPEAFLPVFHSL